MVSHLISENCKINNSNPFAMVTDQENNPTICRECAETNGQPFGGAFPVRDSVRGV